MTKFIFILHFFYLLKFNLQLQDLMDILIAIRNLSRLRENSYQKQTCKNILLHQHVQHFPACWNCFSPHIFYSSLDVVWCASSKIYIRYCKIDGFRMQTEPTVRWRYFFFRRRWWLYIKMNLLYGPYNVNRL